VPTVLHHPSTFQPVVDASNRVYNLPNTSHSSMRRESSRFDEITIGYHGNTKDTSPGRVPPLLLAEDVSKHVHNASGDSHNPTHRPTTRLDAYCVDFIKNTENTSVRRVPPSRHPSHTAGRRITTSTAHPPAVDVSKHVHSSPNAAHSPRPPLPLTFRVTEGKLCHHHPSLAQNTRRRGFPPTSTPLTRVSSDGGVTTSRPPLPLTFRVTEGKLCHHHPSLAQNARRRGIPPISTPLTRVSSDGGVITSQPLLPHMFRVTEGKPCTPPFPRNIVPTPFSLAVHLHPLPHLLFTSPPYLKTPTVHLKMSGNIWGSPP
jgi:hypothetical protein